MRTLKLALAALAVGFFTPWWGISALCLVFGLLFFRSVLEAIFGGFFVTALPCLAMTLYSVSIGPSELGRMMADLIGLPTPLTLALLTAAGFGVVGALASFTGYAFKRGLRST